MRVLHLVHVRWWNASAQYAVHLAAAQHRLGHDVHVWTAKDEPAAKHARDLQVPLEEMTMAPSGWAHLYRRLRKVRTRYDVVNAHHADVQNVALAAFATGGPALVRTRVDVRDAKRSAVNRYLYNRRLDAVIVPGENSREAYVRGLGIDPRQVHTVYGGVDHEVFRPDRAVRARTRAALGIGEDRIVFGLVGRLGAVKGVEVYLEAAAAVHRADPRTLFLVAGRPASGHTEEEYRALAAKFGDAGVRFLGFVADVPALMASLDAGVITSVGSEAHCRVGLEMMSSGLPVVGTQIGVIPEVVKDGETGYIVRSRSAPDLGDRLLRLASDGDLRARLGQAARLRIESHFTFARWVEATGAVYRLARNG